MVFTRPGKSVSAKALHYPLRYERSLDNGEAVFSSELKPEQSGKSEYQVRLYPQHPRLTHPFEMGLMLWL
jgi:starch phosphorylase